MTADSPAWPQEAFMRRALELAARGRSRVSPNPLVGAVVAAGSRIVGEGYHRIYGGPHAEKAALQAAAGRACGADLYTNLEPCAHHGKTPPCVEAIIAAGVRRVVVSHKDPHPRVRGRGFACLRQAGIEVFTGCLAAEAARLNVAYTRRSKSGRPHVILKAGMSLDGRIATRASQSQWITSSLARRHGRELRSRVDAVMVGGRTARLDDPRLSVRCGRRLRPCQPLRVVVEAAFHLSPEARLLQESVGGPVIIYGLTRHDRRRCRLERAGAETVVVQEDRGRVSLPAVLGDLAGRGVLAVLVEGGGELNWSMLQSGLVDQLHWFVAPRLLGGGGIPVLGGQGPASLAQAPAIADMAISPLGHDWLVTGRPVVRSSGGE